MSWWPVSVIHQLSWMRRWNARHAQRTTSGLSGSPTESTWRSEERSNFFTTWSPAAINMRNAVGAEYHTVTRRSSTVLYHASASKRPPRTTLVAPLSHGAKIPYEVPVTHPGSAVHQ